MRKNATEYHIHVNCYQTNRALGRRLIGLGLFEDPITPDPKVNHSCPTHHFTFKGDEKHKVDEVWTKVALALKKDRSFRGYVEEEAIATDRRIHFPITQFKSVIPFPFRITGLVSVPSGKSKATDIHLEAPLELELGFLQEQLIENGFFKILTPKEQIFTLQLAHVGDAKAIVEALRKYFEICGGITTIEMEITSRFLRFPADFEVAPIVPFGGLIF
ncbi:hypothetical protein HY988_06585 [Candidatus Micrarchaeota archaeon]|nr:hypothetical protein [Candidatus Micrarchaeota archaeon]